MCDATQQWQSVRIGDCCDILDNLRVPLNADERSETPGNIPYYGANGVQGYIDKHVFDEPLILLAEDGGYFDEYETRPIAYRVQGKSWVNNHAHVLRVTPGTERSQDFVFYCLEHKNLVPFIKGGTRAKLNQAELREVRIPDPPWPEQRRVAEIFSAVDETIAQTESLIAKTQQIKAGLMRDLFTRGVMPDGRLRPPREEAPKLYKVSPLGWIPREWEVAFLADRKAAGRPHLKTGPFGSSLKLEHWVEVGHPVITIGALGEGEFIESELLYVGESTAQRLREFQLEPGDVVFSRVADVGRSAAICEEHRGWIMSSNLMRISLDMSRVLPGYLQAQLAHDGRVRRQIRATVNSSGRDVANSAILNRLKFVWPTPAEQALILERFNSLESRRRSEVQLVEKFQVQKRGLMHDLLTGRVRVAMGDARKVSSGGA